MLTGEPHVPSDGPLGARGGGLLCPRTPQERRPSVSARRAILAWAKSTATTSMPAESINRSSNRTPSAPWRDSRTIEASRKEAADVRRQRSARLFSSKSFQMVPKGGGDRLGQDMLNARAFPFYSVTILLRSRTVVSGTRSTELSEAIP